ncbi:hypothetical protein PPL_10775 [Heterostelium album PN500]|uniref:Uncharacterized protein n=1 Tax=Heterostelium pallidum (strain ATCC 26659 / Pp 5 / PN500) TaxID=670386 RepID=D3BRY5_HETP5|nr:hypothetical protein PPL_10775 [Heterostelium album PN500]EFA75722.1 hypothetical protein PPL_10775 [Heterostelium album PN500]|eukprot:XP_020427856.1 hypothetical protein PPL_10775 [Heterostelium album PN500]
MDPAFLQYVTKLGINPNDPRNLEKLGDAYKIFMSNDSNRNSVKEKAVQAIRLRPNEKEPYVALATVLQPGETVKLHTGQVVDAKLMYVKVVEMDPSSLNPLIKLYESMTPYEIVTINGKRLSKMHIIAKCVELNPNEADFYAALAFYLQDTNNDDGYVTLNNGKTMNINQLLLQIIHLSPKQAKRPVSSHDKAEGKLQRCSHQPGEIDGQQRNGNASQQLLQLTGELPTNLYACTQSQSRGRLRLRKSDNSNGK